jgi:hypothetical protein
LQVQSSQPFLAAALVLFLVRVHFPLLNLCFARYRSERADSLLERMMIGCFPEISLCYPVPLTLAVAAGRLLYSIPFFRRHGTAHASSAVPKISALLGSK